MLFETRCAGCDTPGVALCTTCRFALVGRTPHAQSHGVIAAVPFTGRARAVMLSLKYRNRRRAARHMAGLLVNRLVEADASADVDVVTWAPTSARRRRSRGFDQGEVIARTVARQLGLPCRALLARVGHDAPQTGRRRAQRLSGPVFRARRGLDGTSVLVIDDVVTTGATLHAARRALSASGANRIVLAAVASTPVSVPRAVPRSVPVSELRSMPRSVPQSVPVSAGVDRRPGGRTLQPATVVPLRRRGPTAA